MAVARFMYRITNTRGQAVPSGTPVTVLTNVAGSPGVPAHIFSDDAGTVEITGQQEAYVPDASGKTVGSEGVTSSVGVVLTDSGGMVSFVANEGDYFLDWAGVQSAVPIEVGDTQVNSYAETYLVKAGVVAVANNLGAPGLAVPEVTVLTKITARVGTAPTGAALIVRVNKNGTLVGTATIAISTTSAQLTGLPVNANAGDILTFDVTQVGSTVAGSDLAVDVVGS